LLTESETQALTLSLLVASVAVVGSLPLGISMGWLLARRRFWGQSALEVLINLPLVMPPVVTGYLLLVTFGRRGPVGSWLESWLGVHLVFDWKGAALAAAVVSFPLMVRAIRLAFAAVPQRLPMTARTLGAGPLDAFWSVSLPLAIPGIVSGSVLAFARSLGEFGATIMIAGNIPGETRTIPLAIYTELESPGGMAQAGRLVIVSVILSAGAIVAGEWLDRWGRKHTGEHG
jgi:molybdate transport system permease protein